jgi:hypothetical protein
VNMDRRKNAHGRIGEARDGEADAIAKGNDVELAFWSRESVFVARISNESICLIARGG